MKGLIIREPWISLILSRKKRSHRLTAKDARERRKQMTTMRRQGYTLAEIGDRFRITGSRVSQILSAG